MASFITQHQESFDKFIEAALQEDVGAGDHSSLACIDAEATTTGKLFVKDTGILAGVELAEYIFKKTDPSFNIEVFKRDGDSIHPGEIAFTIQGRIRTILMLERLVLNLMQRMSGIATKTHNMVAQLEGLHTKLLDTRKTTPLIRFIEKWAVTIGGGTNHRFGLYDMIMLKDNHIDGAGGIEKAIHSAHKYLDSNQLDLKIEVETRNLEEVSQVLAYGGVHRIMLDNFSLDNLRQAVEMIGNKYETEASGGITEENIRSFAETGVDYVSSSAITHSVKSLDLSLKITK